MPVFATRRVTTNVTVYDGSTVAIGGLIREDVQHTEDKLPIFGDLPLIGRLFRIEAEQRKKRNLMVFVTAQLIDPSGQPLNRDAEDFEGDEPDGSLTSTVLASQMFIAPPTATADTGSTSGAAQQERLQREYLVGQAREAYYQGLELENGGDLLNAGTNYRQALQTLPDAGRTADEREVYANAFARVCIALSEKSASEGGLKAANGYIDVATEYAPDHAGLMTMKERLGDPEWYASGDTKSHRAKVARVTENLGHAEAARDLGELDNAEKHFFEVLREDEFNGAVEVNRTRSGRCWCEVCLGRAEHRFI